MEDNKTKKAKEPKLEPQQENVVEQLAETILNKIQPTKTEEPKLINPLRNEKVTVRLIKKKRGFIDDPNSPLYGGLAETSDIVVCVARDRNGRIKPPLTDNEKEFFEHSFGLPENAMSIYKSENNYWMTSTPNCINSVVLTKIDTILDLSQPADYIKYKILLTNDNLICPSIEDLEERPKATYMFVLVNSEQENRSIGNKADVKFECYTKYGEFKDDANALRTIVFLIEGKHLAQSTRIEQLRSKVTSLIDSNTKKAHEVLYDEYLNQKILLIRGVEINVVQERNGLYFNRENGQPLCAAYQNGNATLHNAAKFLADPTNQDLLFALQAQIY